MTRPERVAKAQRLRAEGKTYREIGERLGICTTTAYAYLNPAKRGQWGRKWYRRHLIECPQCGGKMHPKSSLCAECRSEDVHRRALQIEEWWAEGLTCPEIMQRLGWSKGHISIEINRLRNCGYNPPYRRKDKVAA